jgi:hypothetical protein
VIISLLQRTVFVAHPTASMLHEPTCGKIVYEIARWVYNKFTVRQASVSVDDTAAAAVDQMFNQRRSLCGVIVIDVLYGY